MAAYLFKLDKRPALLMLTGPEQQKLERIVDANGNTNKPVTTKQQQMGHVT